MDQTRRITIRFAISIATFAAGVAGHNSCLATQDARHIEVQIVADEMCCKGCAQKIAAQLYAAPGVTAVAADVPKRIVKITAKPSPKLTLERLWRAVEKGKGAPTKLITAQATYTLTKAELLPPSERLAPGHYVIEVADWRDTVDMQRMITDLRAMPGVQRVDMDVSRQTLMIQSPTNQPVSEWALVRIVKQDGYLPVRVSGAFGCLTIEYASQSRKQTAVHPAPHIIQGGIR
jgi:copper chaperone CopZ